MRSALKSLMLILGTFFVLKEIELTFSLDWGWLLLLALVFAALGAAAEFFPPLLCIGGAGFTLFCSNGVEQLINIEWGFLPYLLLIGCSFILTSILLDVVVNGGIQIQSLIFWGIGLVAIAVTLWLPQWTGYSVSWATGDIPRGISFIIIFFLQILLTQKSEEEEG